MASQKVKSYCPAHWRWFLKALSPIHENGRVLHVSNYRFFKPEGFIFHFHLFQLYVFASLPDVYAPSLFGFDVRTSDSPASTSCRQHVTVFLESRPHFRWAGGQELESRNSTSAKIDCYATVALESSSFPIFVC